VQVNQPVPGPGGVNTRRPYLGFGAISNVASSGNSTYHGLPEGRGPFTEVEFLGSYTYSKAIGLGSPALDNILQRGLIRRKIRRICVEWAEPARCAQRFVFSGVYELPFGRGKSFMNAARIAEAELGGWQLNG
jgi:hypothetical protein